MTEIDDSAWGQIQRYLMAKPQTSATRQLKSYWKTGEGAAKIRWGTDGDLTRCHRLVTEAAGPDATTFDVWGYCQNLHQEIFGRSNPRD